MSQTTLCDLRDLVIAAAGDGDHNHKQVCQRASRHADVPYWTVYDVYYRRIKDADHKAVTKLRRAADRYVKNTFTKLGEVNANMAGRLQRIDPDFYCGEIDDLLAASRVCSRLGGAGIGGA